MKNNKKLLSIHTIKKICVCVCVVDINKERYENNDIEVIVDDIGTLWINEKHVEEILGYKNLPVITEKYDSLYKKHRYELVDKSKK